MSCDIWNIYTFTAECQDVDFLNTATGLWRMGHLLSDHCVWRCPTVNDNKEAYIFYEISWGIRDCESTFFIRWRHSKWPTRSRISRGTSRVSKHRQWVIFLYWNIRWMQLFIYVKSISIRHIDLSIYQLRRVFHISEQCYAMRNIYLCSLAMFVSSILPSGHFCVTHLYILWISIIYDKSPIQRTNKTWLCKMIGENTVTIYHDDVIKWKHFPRYWPFVEGIHRSPVNSPHKGQWRGAMTFSLICA